MKFYMSSTIIGAAILTLLFSQSIYALPDTSALERSTKKKEPEIVSWVGILKDDDQHTTEHDHDLIFVNQDTGESYDVVDSPELAKLHCDEEKNLLVKVTAERTPQFLFWGDNLIVKNFEVIEELENAPHTKPKERPNSVSSRSHFRR